MECNLDCPFCYSPHAIPRDYAGSVFGATPAEIAENHARTRITGISFSGGEPLLEMEKLLAWAGWFTRRYPDKYCWIYTNGLLADEARLRRLAAVGIHEIRFNLAATGYDHPTVMQNVAAAARLLPHVAVEIPAIPEHADKLLACLADWCALGVHDLNLHELMYEPGTHSAAMPGARRSVVTADGHHTQLNPESRGLTLAVMQRVQAAGLPLSVNDCSLQSKLRQLRGRRRSLAPLFKAPYEKLVGDEIYESYCAYRREELLFLHPDAVHDLREHYRGHHFIRLARTASLSPGNGGRWIAFEPC
jgi:hypothetical protein